MRDALEHRRLHDIDQVLETDRLSLRKLLGHHRERGARGLADADRQMARRASHGEYEEPPLGGHGVGHEVVDELHAHVTRRLVPERGGAARKGKVVVDGLRHVRHPDRPAGGLGQARGRERRVIASDGDQQLDPELAQRLQAVVHPPVGIVGPLVSHGGVGPRRVEDGTAEGVDTRHVGDRERQDVRGRSLDEMLEPVQDPDHLPARVHRLDRGGGDDGVDPGGGASPAQDPEPRLAFAHGRSASRPRLEA